MSIRFSINTKSETAPFPHYWKMCIGSCHAYMGLREDWRKQMKKCHDELGFQYVRFHGLLNDDMSVYTKKIIRGKEDTQVQYSFYNIDSIFDYLVRIGMKPFIELGFMPEALALGNATCFHYKGNITPPNDYNEWEKLIRLLVQHLTDRYGIEEVRTWFFEVWNEPNLKYFWKGTREEYFKLYKHSASAIKSIDPELRVGGPATSINAWIPEMIEFCERTGAPIDFISTHHYPTDDPLWKNSDLTMEEFFKHFAHEVGIYERGILYKMTAKAKSEAGKLPLYYTEWNTSAMLPDPIHDEAYSAALIAKTIADNDGLVEGYSFWTFSDLFEERGQCSIPFHGGFGLQNIYGIPKPAYRLFELLNKMGDRRMKVEGGGGSNVEMLAAENDTSVTLLVYNHNVPGAPIREEDVCISLKGLACGKTAMMTRIDEDSANPKKKWIELGSPEYPSRYELEEIYQASLAMCEMIEPAYKDNEYVLRCKIKPHGVIAFVIGK